MHYFIPISGIFKSDLKSKYVLYEMGKNDGNFEKQHFFLWTPKDCEKSIRYYHSTHVLSLCISCKARK